MPNEIHDAIIRRTKTLQKQGSMTIDLNSDSDVSDETSEGNDPIEDQQPLIMEPQNPRHIFYS